jgi:hypothetical protein
VSVALAAGLVDRLQRRARQLELAAGLQRDRALSGRLDQPDDVLLVDDRVPAQRVAHAFEQRADAARPGIGDRRMAVDVEWKLLVLGADPPLLARFVARREVSDELVDLLDRPEIGRVARHGEPALPRRPVSAGAFPPKMSALDRRIQGGRSSEKS